MTDLTSPEWSRQTEMVVRNFDYTGVVTNESWRHWTDASTSGRFGRIGYDFIQSINGSEWNISRIPDQSARQDKRSGMEAQDSCKARGKQEWKVARGGYNQKT